jgi:hypothetical protein
MIFGFSFASKIRKFEKNFMSAFTDTELELEKSRHLFLAAFDLRDLVDDFKL